MNGPRSLTHHLDPPPVLQIGDPHPARHRLVRRSVAPWMNLVPNLCFPRKKESSLVMRSGPEFLMPDRLLGPHRMMIPPRLHSSGGILVAPHIPAAAAETSHRKRQKKAAVDWDSKQSRVASGDPWTAHTGLDNCLDGNSRSLYVPQPARCRMATPATTDHSCLGWPAADHSRPHVVLRMVLRRRLDQRR